MTGKLPLGIELLRNVHPNNVHNGQPSRVAFTPTERDEGCLSVDNAERTSPEASHKLFTDPKPDGFGRKSAAVLRITTDHVEAVGKDLDTPIECRADPLEADEEQQTPANPHHALVDMGEDQSIHRDIAKKLLLKHKKAWPS